VLRVEVIIGVIASSIAILAFIARAYANIRRGRRMKRYSDDIARESEAELRRLQEELRAAQQKLDGTRKPPSE
jgi:hypothetical protein